MTFSLLLRTSQILLKGWWWIVSHYSISFGDIFQSSKIVLFFSAHTGEHTLCNYTMKKKIECLLPQMCKGWYLDFHNPFRSLPEKPLEPPRAPKRGSCWQRMGA